MKRKTLISKIFVCSFAVLSVLLISANSTFAQCGSYFKTNYSTNLEIITAPAPNYRVGDLKLDDWTGDGKSDFWHLRRNANGLSNDIVIYPSQPTGYWDWDNPIIYTTSVSNITSDAKVADLNSDGRMDLYFGSGSIQILRNAGNGSLTTSSQLTDSDGSVGSNGHIGFADINSDGLLDWVYTVFINGNSHIRYQLQNPDGSFVSKTSVHTASYTSNKRLGDFNGDGKPDIILSTFTNNQNIYVMIKNLGGGTFEVGNPVATDLYVFIPPVYSDPIRDFNNDGKDDVLSRGAVFFGQADGSFNRVSLSSTNDFLLAAELNGDNNLDIIEIGADFYAVHTGDGAGDFTRTVYQRKIGVEYGLKFEDFSGDGKADLYEMRGSPNPVIPKNIFGEEVVSIRGNICQPLGETKSANFDGNTNTDVITWNPGSGNWSSKNAVWGTGADANAKVFNWGLGSHGDVPAPGDFDGDGKTDYSVYRNSTGIWYIFRSSDSSWLTFQFGITGDIAVPNDYDGGGKTDIAVFRPSEGNWYIWFTETQQFQGLHFGLNEDKPVPADYDGDGKTDVAVFRPSTGVWYYLKSSDNGFAAVLWGISTDIPVPADYDGDGRADLTIYRDGVWWFLRSSDNSYTAIQWGNAGDIPMPVYRNTVSADATLYRPSSNTWHSLDFRYHAGIGLGGSQDVPVYFGLPNN